jgi:hypothetical protein
VELLGRLGISLIAAASLAAAQTPFSTTIRIQDQPVTIGVWASVAGEGPDAARLTLDADLSDLQRQIAPILQAQWKQDNRCGERLTLAQAVLAPEAEAAVLRANVHFEKWACAKAFGKGMVKKLIGGNGAIVVRLTPTLESGSALHIHADVTSIAADGQLGDLLRSGSFGEALQEKIRKTVSDDIEKSSQFEEALPKAVRDIVVLKEVQFGDRGEGRLGLRVIADARLSAEQAQALAASLQGK